MHAAAIEDYDRAIELDEAWAGRAGAFCNRALAKSELGMHQAAVEDCNLAIHRDPTSATAFNNRALAKIRLHQATDESGKEIRLEAHLPGAFSTLHEDKDDAAARRQSIKHVSHACRRNRTRLLSLVRWC